MESQLIHYLAAFHDAKTGMNRGQLFPLHSIFTLCKTNWVLPVALCLIDWHGNIVDLLIQRWTKINKYLYILSKRHTNVGECVSFCLQRNRFVSVVVTLWNDTKLSIWQQGLFSANSMLELCSKVAFLPSQTYGNPTKSWVSLQWILSCILWIQIRTLSCFEWM